MNKILNPLFSLNIRETKPEYALLVIAMVYIASFAFMLLTGRIVGQCVSDECGYIQLGINILNGYYSSRIPAEINLWWGPGYPVLLAPLIAIGLTREWFVFVNVLLSVLTIFVLYVTARFFLSKSLAVLAAIVWALYYLHFPYVFSALSEPLATFLAISFLYFLIRAILVDGQLSNILICGLIFGFLILTKVIFAYVLVALFLLTLIASLYERLRPNSRKVALALLVAFITTVPYQFYTFNLTGKVFYFSNAGGSSLYFMTSPHSGEFGEWNNGTFTANCGFATDVPCNAEKFARNHAHIFASAEKLNPIERDDYLKKIAFENIINHPLKYMRNYVNNFSRMLFNIPNSYFYQREQTIARILPNSILLTLMILAVGVNLFYLSRFPISVLVIPIFVASYLSIHLLVSSEPRHFNIMVPCILVWVFNSLRVLCLGRLSLSRSAFLRQVDN